MHTVATHGPGVDPARGRWARDTLASLVGLPGVVRVGLALVEGGGRELLFTASDRADGASSPWCHIDAYDEVPLNVAIRTGAPVVGALEELRGRFAGFVDRQAGTPTVALAAVPVVASGQALGGYVLFFDAPQPFEDGQVGALLDAGRKVGTALRGLQRAHVRRPVALAHEPVPPGAAVVVHDVDPEPAAVPEARGFLRRTLADWGVEASVSQSAELCLSELVTNVVLHTDSGCAIRILLDRGVLTTTVRDCGGPHASSAGRPVDPLGVHGRGFQIVEAVADRWGSELDATGATVWFVLET